MGVCADMPLIRGIDVMEVKYTVRFPNTIPVCMGYPQYYSARRQILGDTVA
jgi:hypothetical protein